MSSGSWELARKFSRMIRRVAAVCFGLLSCFFSFLILEWAVLWAVAAGRWVLVLALMSLMRWVSSRPIFRSMRLRRVIVVMARVSFWMGFVLLRAVSWYLMSGVSESSMTEKMAVGGVVTVW